MFFFQSQFLLCLFFIAIILVGFTFVITSINLNIHLKGPKLSSNQLLKVILGILLVIVGSISLCFTLLFGYNV